MKRKEVECEIGPFDRVCERCKVAKGPCRWNGRRRDELEGEGTAEGVGEEKRPAKRRQVSKAVVVIDDDDETEREGVVAGPSRVRKAGPTRAAKGKGRAEVREDAEEAAEAYREAVRRKVRDLEAEEKVIRAMLEKLREELEFM